MRTGFQYLKAAKPCRLSFKFQVQLDLPIAVNIQFFSLLRIAMVLVNFASGDREENLIASYLQTYTALSC